MILNQQSGGEIISPILGLYDHYDEIYAIDNESVLFFDIVESGSTSAIQSLLEGSSSITACEGKFEIKNIFLIATPDSEERILIRTTGIDSEMLDSSLEVDSISEIEVGVRNCISGESYTDSGR